MAPATAVPSLPSGEAGGMPQKSRLVRLPEKYGGGVSASKAHAAKPRSPVMWGGAHLEKQAEASTARSPVMWGGGGWEVGDISSTALLPCEGAGKKSQGVPSGSAARCKEPLTPACFAAGRLGAGRAFPGR